MQLLESLENAVYLPTFNVFSFFECSFLIRVLAKC